MRKRLIQDGPLERTGYSFAFPAEDDAGRDLPGGAYVLQAVVGADTLRRYTIHTDTFGAPGDFSGVGRALGTTGTDGHIATTDRTAAPGLVLPGVAILATNEGGGAIATLRFGAGVEVAVEDGDGSVLARKLVTLRDGPNAVTVTLPGGAGI